jgi:glycosyltransferase involved in cell wall biosynthesis
MSALVSVVIPVFNGERYLRETLDSVFAQTHRPLEVIVVDDGSTDHSLELARASGHPLIALSQPNGGHASARNHGLAHATGEFIAFDDADDLWDPHKLALQLARFDARPELGVVFAHLQNFWSPDVEESARVTGEELERPVPGYTSVTMLARRELFTRIGTFDVSLRHGNDRDWFCRATEQGVAVEMMPDVLVHRRLHAANRSAALGANSRAEYLRILKASLDRRRNAAGGDDDVAALPFQKQ